MSELVFKSALAPDTVRLKIIPTFSGRVQLIVVDSFISAGCTLSKPDAYRLRDFLNKELGEQAPEPSKPQKELLILAYGADPSNAQGSRFLHVSDIAYATKLAEQLVNEKPSRPVWLGQLTKQFVQPTPSYEWKDL